MPDLPQTRIELERLLARYRQAPESRLFAPLADAYRSVGQVDAAVRLLQDGLQHHPGYVSALVLLGQCELDRQREEVAEKTFARVLELDPENLVALRYRAEQARRRGALERAVEILRRLLEIDPFDREVQADLGLLATALEHKASADRAAAAPAAWPPEEIAFEAAPPARAAAAPPAPSLPAVAPPISAPAPAPPAAPELEPAGELPDLGGPARGELEPPPIDLRRVAPRHAATGAGPPERSGTAFAAPKPAETGAAPRPSEDAEEATTRNAAWKVSRQEDHIVVRPGEMPPRGPIRSVETRLWTEQRPPAPAAAPVPAPPPPPAAAPQAPSPAPPPEPSRPDEFATLSMARIYESQGYLEKALAIYDELHRKHPEDREVAERLASLQRRLSGLAAALPPVSPGMAPSPPPEPSHREPAEEETRVEWRLLDVGSPGEETGETAGRLRRVTDEVRSQERSRRHTFIGRPPEPPPAPAPPEPAAPGTGEAAAEPLDELTRPDFQRFLKYVRSLKR